MDFAVQKVFDRSKLLLLFYLVTFAQLPAAANELPQNREDLPQGYYIYLGPSSGNYPKQKFSIENGGKLIWNEDKPVKKEKQKDKGASKSQGNWVRNQKGVVEWKDITLQPQGNVKLQTDFVCGPGFSPRGSLKYKILLSDIQRIPNFLQIQLLDANGFKLTQFLVHGRQFILNSKYTEPVYEANDQTPCLEKDYANTRDCLINAN